MAPPLSLWRNRDFMALWGGQVVSVLGSRITATAMPLLVLATTGSPATAGLVAAAGSLPFLVLHLPAGALVDRWPGRSCGISRRSPSSKVPASCSTVCPSARRFLSLFPRLSCPPRWRRTRRRHAARAWSGRRWAACSTAPAGYLLETIGPTGAVLVLSGVMLLTAVGATVSPTVRHAPS